MRFVNTQKRMVVAILGQPRSGTTIVTSFINSIDDSLVVGEPHRMLAAERPPDKPNLATHCDTEYGILRLFPSGNALQQVAAFSIVANIGKPEEDWIKMIGFKECHTNDLDAISVLDGYGEVVTETIVTFRNPRKNLASMLELSPVGHLSPFVQSFNRCHSELIALLDRPHVYPLIHEWFRQDPVGELRRATGWHVEGDFELRKYAGGGDPKATGSTEVFPVDRRRSFLGDVGSSEDEYWNLLAKLSQEDEFTNAI